MPKLPLLYLLENRYDKSDINYWRLKLINIASLLICCIFLFLAIFNFIETRLYFNATIDIIGIIAVIIIFSLHSRLKNIEITTTLVLLVVAIMSLTIIFVAEKNYGIVMWAIFFPILAFFLKGSRYGLIFSLGYYLALFTYLFTIAGREFSHHYLIELIAILTTLLAIIYYYEASRETAYELLQKASIEDPLTGLFNRRHFNRIFDQEINRAKRNQQPLAFFIMDIDHFKQYNDFYGHLRGDEALRRVSEVINYHMRRSTDYAFRLGGEEFGCILTGLDTQEYYQQADKLRQAIEELQIEHEQNSGYKVLTVSIGLTVANPNNDYNSRIFYHLADQALYSAKEQGRNCTIHV